MRKKTENVSATLRKAEIKIPANLDWFKKRQLFMCRDRFKDTIVLSSGVCTDATFQGTVVYSNEAMNIGQQNVFNISAFVPTNGVIEVKLK